ncbi:MAG: hypothetical protein SGJ20_02375 [Planctomycetota bacterium]|nr:hypothetical protein [Planctomycetota bacterium]
MQVKTPSLRTLLTQIHNDEQGAVSLETILIIGVIALPVLIFLVKFGWPAIKGYFIDRSGDVGIEIPQG